MTDHDPQDDYDDSPGKPRWAPERLLRLVSAGLWAFACFQIVVSAMCLLMSLLVYIVRWTHRADPRHADVTEVLVLMFAGLVGGLLSGLVMFGVRRMEGFRSYPWAITAAGLTIFSLPCVYVGFFTVPFGVWALSVLLRSDVRSRFAANRSDPILPPEPSDGRTD